MTIRAIVTDIEGTTTPIAFVHEVLFPYARARLAEFCAARQADPVVAEALAAVRAESGAQSLDAVVAVLLQWMDEDRKAGPLKTLQGLIWQAGYEAGVLKGQVYEDAAALLMCWESQGLKLYVYSAVILIRPSVRKLTQILTRRLPKPSALRLTKFCF